MSLESGRHWRDHLSSRRNVKLSVEGDDCSNRINYISVPINRDHVHMLVSILPILSVSRAVQYLKGRSSQKLLNELGILRKRSWGGPPWVRGFWLASSGDVTDEVWSEYVKTRTPPKPDDNFAVT